MKALIAAALLLTPALATADYCQALTNGYLCRPEKTVEFPTELVLIYNGDIDGKSSNNAQFVDYSPLPAVAHIEVYLDGDLVFDRDRSVGQSFKLRNVFFYSSIEVNIWDTEGNYSQFVRIDPYNATVGDESGGVGIWWAR